MVSVNGKKLQIARALLSPQTKFSIQKPSEITEIFRDSQILALAKPAFLTSEEIAQAYPEWVLLHRLDKETSGILLLVKNQSEFHLKAKESFKQMQVKKRYIAIVEGIIQEECEITTPLIVKKGKFAKVEVSKNGEASKGDYKDLSFGNFRQKNQTIHRNQDGQDTPNPRAFSTSETPYYWGYTLWSKTCQSYFAPCRINQSFRI